MSKTINIINTHQKNKHKINVWIEINLDSNVSKPQITTTQNFWYFTSLSIFSIPVSKRPNFI